MGNYIDTATSLEVLMPGVSFDTATTSLVSKCVEWAEDEVNKRLARRYDVSDFPTTTSTMPPPMVVTLSEKLAIGYTWQNMSRGGKESLSRAKMFIKDALDNLDAIADYEASLVDKLGAEVIERDYSTDKLKSTTDGYSETFNEDDQLYWEADQDKLDAISDDRD